MTVEDGTVRVLLLARHGRKGASSRVRSYQHLDRLRAAGIEVDASPLLPDRYLEGYYGTGAKPRSVAAAGFVRRLGRLLAAGRYDLLWIEKELFPWLPAGVERLVTAGLPYLVDFDDARWHRYGRHDSALVRRLLSGKLDAVMRRAEAVIAGSRYLADRAEAAGARRVHRIPSGVELDDYPPADALAPDRPPDAPFTVGWIGTPFTARYLGLVAGPLAELTADPGTRFVAVGAGSALPAGIEAEVRPWSREDEVDELIGFDVGIMPVPDEPFERGKCAYKAIQYMAAGRPVVASPVGAAPDVVAEGETGFLADTGDEWMEALERLRTDPDLRARMGRAGRARVEARYCTEVLSPRLARALREAAEEAGG